MSIFVGLLWGKSVFPKKNPGHHYENPNHPWTNIFKSRISLDQFFQNTKLQSAAVFRSGL